MADTGFVPHIMIVESRLYPDIADEFVRGAVEHLEKVGATYKRVAVPTLFEVPVAIRYAIRAIEIFPARKRFDGYLALGCSIKEAEQRADLVSSECTHALMGLSTQFSLALGYGIAAVETKKAAWECASAKSDDIGARAAANCLDMVQLKTEFKLFPRAP